VSLETVFLFNFTQVWRWWDVVLSDGEDINERRKWRRRRRWRERREIGTFLLFFGRVSSRK
jgi:hypothetical protein